MTPLVRFAKLKDLELELFQRIFVEDEFPLVHNYAISFGNYQDFIHTMDDLVSHGLERTSQ